MKKFHIDIHLWVEQPKSVGSGKYDDSIIENNIEEMLLEQLRGLGLQPVHINVDASEFKEKTQ